MKVLVTGHDGYIGRVMVPLLQAAGHAVVGLDSGLYSGCTLGEEPPDVPALWMDVRDVECAHLKGFDAVIHLAAISNDPVGDLDPSCTYAINHEASVRLAGLAQEAGVGRFLFSSSCTTRTRRAAKASWFAARGERCMTSSSICGKARPPSATTPWRC